MATQIINNPAALLELAMDNANNSLTMLASFTFNPELAALTATLFVQRFPDAKASAKTIINIRSSLGDVPVGDTEAPWTITFLKESRTFVLARRRPHAPREVSPEKQLELDREAINEIYKRRGSAWLVDEANAYAEMDKEAEKEAA
jgi:hypothetical protein